MLISHNHKFIIIDIPKTGSRSRRVALTEAAAVDIVGGADREKQYYQHATALEAKSIFNSEGWNWSSYYSCVFVRNPWKRYFSFYNYLKKCAGHHGEEGNAYQLKIWRDAWELFQGEAEQSVLKKIIKSRPSQGRWYLDDHKNVIVSRLARFEDLYNEFNKFCQNVGISQMIELPHENKSENAINIREVYNDELIEMVQKKDWDVINRFGYEYPG